MQGQPIGNSGSGGKVHTPISSSTKAVAPHALRFNYMLLIQEILNKTLDLLSSVPSFSSWTDALYRSPQIQNPITPFPTIQAQSPLTLWLPSRPIAAVLSHKIVALRRRFRDPTRRSITLTHREQPPYNQQPINQIESTSPRVRKVLPV